MRIERLLLLAAGALLLLALGTYIFELIYRSGYEEVQIVSFPDEVSVEVDGQPLGVRDSVYLEPGSYTIRASSEGFASEYRFLEIDDDSKNEQVFFELTAESDEAKQWVSDNQDKLTALNNRVSQSAIDSQSELVDRHPIVAELPYRTSLFSIGYQRQTESDFVVTINAPDVYVPYALTRIEQWGYNPAELPLVFTNQRNPFDE